MGRLSSILDGLRTYWDNLTGRERLLIGALGGVLGLLIVLLPVYLLSTSIGALEEENAEISRALRQIARSRDRILQARAEEAERTERYARGVPPDNWLSEQVEEQSLSLTRVQDLPDRAQGNIRIHTKRAHFQGVGLRPTILLLAELKNDPHPVAIERIHLEHPTPGDRYNAEIGFMTFELPGAGGPDAGVPRGPRAAARPPR